MKKRPDLPPIDLTPQRPDAGAKGLPSLPPRTLDDDSAVEEAGRAVASGWGASTRLPPTAPARPPSSPTLRLNIDIPDYLDQALRDAAHHQRKSVRALVLEALHAAGYTVLPQDMVADRRRKRG
jgi:hypothetical protein